VIVLYFAVVTPKQWSSTYHGAGSCCSQQRCHHPSNC